MRTTIDLPEDLHQAATRLAQAHRQSLSRTVADLVRAGLQPRPDEELEINPRTGLPVVRIGGPITSADVRAFLDED